MDRAYAVWSAEKTKELLAIDSPTGYTRAAAEWTRDEFAAHFGGRLKVIHFAGLKFFEAEEMVEHFSAIGQAFQGRPIDTAVRLRDDEAAELSANNFFDGQVVVAGESDGNDIERRIVRRKNLAEETVATVIGGLQHETPRALQNRRQHDAI